MRKKRKIQLIVFCILLIAAAAYENRLKLYCRLLG